MRPALHVVAPGLLSTVQDLGRPGYQRFGIPVSGALDPVSLRAANALVGNPPDCGALEVAYVGPTLSIEADDVRLSFVGATASIEILSEACAIRGERIEGMRSVRLSRGMSVRIGSLSGGAVLYVAVEGGFDIEPIFGSVSTCLRGGFGGFHGRALAAGDRLPLRRACASDRQEHRLDGLDLARPMRFRTMAGPQSDSFAPRELSAFFESEYSVCAGSDRMGLRLEGRPVAHARSFDVISDGIAPGSIQVPGSGQPLVLLADRQTTGGYPKIATVISADLPALGRVPIGGKIAFELVTAETARVLRSRLMDEIETIEARLVPLAADRPSRNLLDCNLVSGVVDAHSFTM